VAEVMVTDVTVVSVAVVTVTDVVVSVPVFVVAVAVRVEEIGVVLSASRSPGFSVTASGSSVVVDSSSPRSSGASVVVVVVAPSRSTGSSREIGTVVPVDAVGACVTTSVSVVTVVVTGNGGQLPHKIGQIFFTAGPTMSLLQTLGCRGHVDGSASPLHFPVPVVPVVVVVVAVAVAVVTVGVVDVVVVVDDEVEEVDEEFDDVGSASRPPGFSVTTSGSSVVVVGSPVVSTDGMAMPPQNSSMSTMLSKLVSKSVTSSSEVNAPFSSASAFGNTSSKVSGSVASIDENS